MVGSLWLVYVAGYAWSVGVPDTARDVFMAYRIRHGLEYPLEGPVLGIPHAIHFGPIWFYLLALPLWVRDSWLSLVVFEGIVCGLKFPLAYYCGRKLVGARFGLLWAAALAFPGWSSMEPLVPFNPNGIGVAFFATLAMYLRCGEDPARPLHLFLLGLAIGFAIHVHPTTVPFALFAVPVLYRHSGTAAGLLKATAGLGCGAIVLFMPYVASQAMNGWPDWRGARNYVSSQVDLANVLRLPDLLIAEFHSGPKFAAQYLADWIPLGAQALAAVFALLVALPFVLAFTDRDRETRRLLLVFASAVLALSAWVLALRTTTPFYFSYVVMPMVAGLVAIGIHMATRARRPARTVPIVLALLALQAAVTWGMCAKSEAGGGVVLSQVLDIKDREARAQFSDVWFPALHREALGRVLCAHEGPLALHAVLAYVEDRSAGLDALFACGRDANIVLGGAGTGAHWVGVMQGDWNALKAKPSCSIGPLVLVPAERVVRSSEHAIADGKRYFPRDVATSAGPRETIEFSAPGGDAVVLSNFLFGYEQVAVIKALAGNAEAPALSANSISRIYESALQTDAVDWRIEVAASSSGAVDVVSIDRKARAPIPECSSTSR